MYDQTEQQSSGLFDHNRMPMPTKLASSASAAIVIATENSSLSLQDNNIPTFTQVDPHHHHHLYHNYHQDQKMEPHMELNEQHYQNIYNNNNTDNTTSYYIPTNVVEEMSLSHFEETPTQNNNNTTDHLLTQLHIPKCSFTSSTPFSLLSGISMADTDTPSGSGHNSLSFDRPGSLFDPMYYLNNLPPQPSPLLRDLVFQSLPPNNNGYADSTQASENMIMNGYHDHHDGGGGEIGDHHQYQQYHHNNHEMNVNGILEFARENACFGDGKKGKCPKMYVSEKQRRENFKDKYDHLKSLLPNCTKQDRATIVLDAIQYIDELKRTVAELKLLAEKKRLAKGRQASPENGSSTTSQLRSSWIQRKCKDTEVDVRITDDVATITLVQRKKVNCLLSVSRTLDELQLDLRHVAGGHVGDYYSYLFNTKICEGSCVYASAIANKLIEVVERPYGSAAAQPTTSY